MPDRFGDVARAVRLHVPAAPYLLCQRWVMDTYRNLNDRRPWMARTVAGQMPFLASRTLASCTVTLGSKLVTSAGLFVASDAGRTFSSGTYPLYQIARVIDANTIELVLEYQGLSTGAITNGYIQDAYATMPADFGQFIIVVDPVNQRIVPWWATQMEIDLLDPTRTSVESVPRMLAGAQPSPLTASIGRMQYEYWPKPSAQGALQYYYAKTAVQPRDEDYFPGVFRDRTDVIELGALARAAKWPGTKEQPNAFFNLGLARQYQLDYEANALQLDLRDDDQSQQSWDTVPWQRWSAWAWAYDTRLLQMTDATIADYFGGGGWLGTF